MEPITTAMAAFSAIKAGVSAGREIASLGKEIGSLFDAIDSVKGDHQKKKSRQIMSANEEALDTFVARKQAEDLEHQLRQIVIATRGISAWQELIRLRGQIRTERAEAERSKRARRQKLVEDIVLWVGIILLIGICLAVLVFFVGRKMGNW